MRNFFLFIISIQIPFAFFAQEKLTWDNFANVSFTEVYNVHYDDYFLKPNFGTVIQSYEGSKVRIKGYFLDFSAEKEFYMVSKNPMSSCFFCGGAGPESIIEVVFKQKTKFETDQVVEITGILQLNADDVDHCNYILKEATGRLIE